MAAPIMVTRRRVIAALALAPAAALLADPALARRRGTPTRTDIQRLVAREARELGVPVALALAVARAESDFDIYARSRKGARGVMQIMPRTARDEYGIPAGLLWNPRINVRLGLHFLKRLLKRYQGRVDLALSYYNGGSAVGDLPHARVIPATRRYVSKVRKLRRVYSRAMAGNGHDGGYGIAGKPGSRGGTEFRADPMLPGYSGDDHR